MPITCFNVVAVVPSYQDEEYYLRLDKRIMQIENWAVEELADQLPRPARQKLLDLIEEAATLSLASEDRDASLIRRENSQ